MGVRPFLFGLIDMNPSEFLSDFFKYSAGAIFITSLANERGAGRAAAACGRRWDRIDELVLQKWSKPDRGTYFCVATITPGQAVRSKDTVHEICCLHCDIDHDKVDATPDAIRRTLETLKYPPSKVIASGHGFHAYWLLSEALPVSPELIVQAEIALRGLANMLGGDPACCEIARLLRLPGSLNTKNGEKIPVRVIVGSGRCYELDDLRAWIAETRVLIPRKGEAPGDNPFLNVSMPGGGPAVDVEGRLNAMRFQGAGDTSIHATQVSTSAALLNRGMPIGEVVATVLAETRRAAGADGERWDWVHEERDIRAMCASFVRKKLDGQRPPRVTGMTMEQLGAMEFAALSFLVPDLIPSEGVCLFASKPKVGKSWFLFDLCLAASMQRDFLGGRQPAPGHTLYLALEDNPRRLRARGEKLLSDHFGPWPTNMRVETEWPRADEGGIDQIRDWVIGVRAGGGKVAIDVLKKFRPKARDRQAAFDQDYESLEGLCKLSAELSIAIVVAHHQRKAKSEDLIDTVSGTLGLSAVSDAILVIDRQDDSSLRFDTRGRDVPNAQFAAIFDKATCRWRIVGEAGEVRRSEAWNAVSEVLRSGELMPPAEITAETGLKASTLRSALRRMRQDGAVEKVKGKYRLTKKENP